MSTSTDQNLRIRLAGYKPVVRFITRLNVWLYKATGGRFANEVDSCPICLVTMRGRKTGKMRTIAVMYNPVDEKVLLVASLGGSPRNPAWVYNLRAHPEVVIQIGKEKQRMLAVEASDDQKARYWPIAVAGFPAYSDYQARTERDIPLFICKPAWRERS